MATGICPVGDHPFEYTPKQGTRRVYCSDEHQHRAAAQRARERGERLPERRCPRCDTTKKREEFAGDTAPYCKPCMAAWARERRAEVGRAPEYTRKERLRNYGLTPERFEEIFQAQGRKCAVCGRTEPKGKGAGGWHVDHDHAHCPGKRRSCGKCIRGILCSNCNIGLGNLQDDPVVIRALLDYLLTWQARREAEGHLGLLEPEGT